MKKFLNGTVFLNFIREITSVKFFVDFVTKTTSFISNDLKMIDVLNSIISASSVLMQMLQSVVENSNFSKGFFLTHLNESAEKIMISFVIDFDSWIVFLFVLLSFFFFFFLAFSVSRPFRVPSHLRRTSGRRRKVKKKPPLRFFCVFFLNWDAFRSDRFTNFAEWDSCFSRGSLRSLRSFVEWTIYRFLHSQK